MYSSAEELVVFILFISKLNFVNGILRLVHVCVQSGYSSVVLFHYQTYCLVIVRFCILYSDLVIVVSPCMGGSKKPHAI